MPKLNDEKPQAVVSWCAIDIQEKRPDWTVKRCQKFLEDNEEDIVLAMIEAGGEAIDDYLDHEED
jgi:hypothetical protein